MRRPMRRIGNGGRNVSWSPSCLARDLAAARSLRSGNTRRYGRLMLAVIPGGSSPRVGSSDQSSPSTTVRTGDSTPRPRSRPCGPSGSDTAGLRARTRKSMGRRRSSRAAGGRGATDHRGWLDDAAWNRWSYAGPWYRKSSAPPGPATAAGPGSPKWLGRVRPGSPPG